MPKSTFLRSINFLILNKVPELWATEERYLLHTQSDALEDYHRPSRGFVIRPTWSKKSLIPF